MREFVFGFDVPDGAARSALAARLQEHLRTDGCSFDARSMRLTVQAADLFDAHKLAKQAVRAATEGTVLYTEPESENLST